jgi:hypothetical protein
MSKDLRFEHYMKGKRHLKRMIIFPLFMLLSALTFATKAPPSIGLAKGFAKKVPPVSVTGTVVDSKGAPIAAVTVKVKNGGAAAVTSVDGAFKITLETGNETLVFSSIGYKTIEVAARGQSNLRVVLTDDIGRLDDVVVIGYGAVKKRDLTGAVSSVKA